MRPSEFLLRWNERPILSGFVRRWIPARTARYSWGRVLAFTACVAGLLAVLLSAPFVILGATVMVPWIALTAAELGACVGLSISLLSRLCWNQRAARLAADPDCPELTAPSPRTGLWPRVALGFGYLVIIGLVVPLLLFYAIEDARGAWAWRQLQAELKAKGECYGLPCVIPPPARDEDNFFGTPFWQQFIYRKEHLPNGGTTNIWVHGSRPDYTTNFTLPNDPRTVKHRGIPKPETYDGHTDLAAWAAQFQFVTTNRPNGGLSPDYLTFPLPDKPGRPADDVLLALSKFDRTLSEFASAANRPRNREPVHYEEHIQALLPGLAALRSGARICQLRALARLENGDSAGAAADVLLAYRLGESLNEEFLLISQLVRYAIDSTAHHALWEGLVTHRWNETQLAAFQQRLSQSDYAPSFIRALEGERALVNQLMEMLLSTRKRTQLPDQVGGGGDFGVTRFEAFTFDTLMPSGWLRQNQVGLLAGYQLILEQARNAMAPTNRTGLLADLRRQGNQADRVYTIAASQPSPCNLMLRLLLPAVGKAEEKANRAQTVAQMATIACALERHRLAHSMYPATLNELVPVYLATVPADWMSGQPFHYERTDNGWFRLWSVGPDGKDDGGVYRDETKQKSGPDQETLDWPWPEPLPMRERLF